ncbi:MAG: hypothetical protein EBT47_14555 [Chloroflexi bacterium]|nr:hypothetical protein [Chloroflexota bacterium]
MRPAISDLFHEDTLIRRGVLSFVGVDEVGRGAWAGPIVAGAAVLNPVVYADRSGETRTARHSNSQPCDRCPRVGGSSVD